MAQKTAAPEAWFSKAWTLFYDGWNFAQFLSATVFGAWASRMTGVSWSTPLGPWLAVAAAILFGVAIVRLVRSAWRRIHVVVDRPTAVVAIESSGTEKPVLEITHFGAPLTFSAEGRIVRALDMNATVKPTQNRFACELQPPEGKKNSQRMTLKDGEWAHIVLADIVQTTTDQRSWLRIRRGTYNRGSLADDSGVEMEITIKTEPGWPLGTVKRLIRVTRVGNSITAVAVGD